MTLASLYITNNNKNENFPLWTLKYKERSGKPSMCVIPDYKLVKHSPCKITVDMVYPIINGLREYLILEKNYQENCQFLSFESKQTKSKKQKHRKKVGKKLH